MITHLLRGPQLKGPSTHPGRDTQILPHPPTSTIFLRTTSTRFMVGVTSFLVVNSPTPSSPLLRTETLPCRDPILRRSVGLWALSTRPKRLGVEGGGVAPYCHEHRCCVHLCGRATDRSPSARYYSEISVEHFLLSKTTQRHCWTRDRPTVLESR